jgi:hypothetical protein
MSGGRSEMALLLPSLLLAKPPAAASAASEAERHKLLWKVGDIGETLKPPERTTWGPGVE